MNKKEVGLLLKKMNAIYPGKLKLEAETVEAWHMVLEQEDYQQVLERFKRHARGSSFLPTASELVTPARRAYDVDNPLEKQRRWEEEASGRPIG